MHPCNQGQTVLGACRRNKRNEKKKKKMNSSERSHYTRQEQCLLSIAKKGRGGFAFFFVKLAFAGIIILISVTVRILDYSPPPNLAQSWCFTTSSTMGGKGVFVSATTEATTSNVSFASTVLSQQPSGDQNHSDRKITKSATYSHCSTTNTRRIQRSSPSTHALPLTSPSHTHNLASSSSLSLSATKDRSSSSKSFSQTKTTARCGPLNFIVRTSARTDTEYRTESQVIEIEIVGSGRRHDGTDAAFLNDDNENGFMEWLEKDFGAADFSSAVPEDQHFLASTFVGVDWRPPTRFAEVDSRYQQNARVVLVGRTLAKRSAHLGGQANDKRLKTSNSTSTSGGDQNDKGSAKSNANSNKEIYLFVDERFTLRAVNVLATGASNSLFIILNSTGSNTTGSSGDRSATNNKKSGSIRTSNSPVSYGGFGGVEGAIPPPPSPPLLEPAFDFPAAPFVIESVRRISDTKIAITLSPNRHIFVPPPPSTRSSFLSTFISVERWGNGIVKTLKSPLHQMTLKIVLQDFSLVCMPDDPSGVRALLLLGSTNNDNDSSLTLASFRPSLSSSSVSSENKTFFVSGWETFVPEESPCQVYEASYEYLKESRSSGNFVAKHHEAENRSAAIAISPYYYNIVNPCGIKVEPLQIVIDVPILPDFYSSTLRKRAASAYTLASIGYVVGVASGGALVNTVTVPFVSVPFILQMSCLSRAERRELSGALLFAAPLSPLLPTSGLVATFHACLSGLILIGHLLASVIVFFRAKKIIRGDDDNNAHNSRANNGGHDGATRIDVLTSSRESIGVNKGARQSSTTREVPQEERKSNTFHHVVSILNFSGANLGIHKAENGLTHHPRSSPFLSSFISRFQDKLIINTFFDAMAYTRFPSAAMPFVSVFLTGATFFASRGLLAGGGRADELFSGFSSSISNDDERSRDIDYAFSAMMGAAAEGGSNSSEHASEGFYYSPFIELLDSLHETLAPLNQVLCGIFFVFYVFFLVFLLRMPVIFGTRYSEMVASISSDSQQLRSEGREAMEGSQRESRSKRLLRSSPTPRQRGSGGIPSAVEETNNTVIAANASRKSRSRSMVNSSLLNQDGGNLSTSSQRKNGKKHKPELLPSVPSTFVRDRVPSLWFPSNFWRTSGHWEPYQHVRSYFTIIFTFSGKNESVVIIPHLSTALLAFVVNFPFGELGSYASSTQDSFATSSSSCINFQMGLAIVLYLLCALFFIIRMPLRAKLENYVAFVSYLFLALLCWCLTTEDSAYTSILIVSTAICSIAAVFRALIFFFLLVRNDPFQREVCRAEAEGLANAKTKQFNADRHVREGPRLGSRVREALMEMSFTGLERDETNYKAGGSRLKREAGSGSSDEALFSYPSYFDRQSSSVALARPFLRGHDGDTKLSLDTHLRSSLKGSEKRKDKYTADEGFESDATAAEDRVSLFVSPILFRDNDEENERKISPSVAGGDPFANVNFFLDPISIDASSNDGLGYFYRQRNNNFFRREHAFANEIGHLEEMMAVGTRGGEEGGINGDNLNTSPLQHEHPSYPADPSAPSSSSPHSHFSSLGKMLNAVLNVATNKKWAAQNTKGNDDHTRYIAPMRIKMDSQGPSDGNSIRSSSRRQWGAGLMIAGTMNTTTVLEERLHNLTNKNASAAVSIHGGHNEESVDGKLRLDYEDDGELVALRNALTLEIGEQREAYHEKEQLGGVVNSGYDSDDGPAIGLGPLDLAEVIDDDIYCKREDQQRKVILVEDLKETERLQLASRNGTSDNSYNASKSVKAYRPISINLEDIISNNNTNINNEGVVRSMPSETTSATDTAPTTGNALLPVIVSEAEQVDTIHTANSFSSSFGNRWWPRGGNGGGVAGRGILRGMSVGRNYDTKESVPFVFIHKEGEGSIQPSYSDDTNGHEDVEKSASDVRQVLVVDRRFFDHSNKESTNPASAAKGTVRDDNNINNTNNGNSGMSNAAAFHSVATNVNSSSSDPYVHDETLAHIIQKHCRESLVVNRGEEKNGREETSETNGGGGRGRHNYSPTGRTLLLSPRLRRGGGNASSKTRSEMERILSPPSRITAAMANGSNNPPPISSSSSGSPISTSRFIFPSHPYPPSASGDSKHDKLINEGTEAVQKAAEVLYYVSKRPV